MEKYEQVLIKANSIISSFPKSKNGQNFIKLKNGRKLFFSIFIENKKYLCIESFIYIERGIVTITLLYQKIKIRQTIFNLILHNKINILYKTIFKKINIELM